MVENRTYRRSESACSLPASASHHTTRLESVTVRQQELHCHWHPMTPAGAIVIMPQCHEPTLSKQLTSANLCSRAATTSTLLYSAAMWSGRRPNCTVQGGGAVE
jgi:hypothetical protein